ncbi:MAG: hypothetical protein KC473_02735 [Candidatus Dadabacteria bacterium]|nr:hypothetical protein [Candidatus Dadabacteria bacterium]
MRKVIASIMIITFVLAAHYSTASTAGKPPDVSGWESLKWGMTGDEVKAASGKDLKVHKPREDSEENAYSDIELSELEIGGVPLRASLWMDSGTKTLRKIVFVPRNTAEGYGWAETFIKLEESLASKYGPPDVENTSNDPGTSADRKWHFPSTDIELSYLRLDGTEMLLLIFSGKDEEDG